MKANISDSIYRKRNPSTGKNNKFWSLVNATLITQLKNYYALDYEMFGYNNFILPQ